MKHNPTIRFLGVWYVIETDASGKSWAVSGDIRLPYGQGGLTGKAIDSKLAIGR